MLSEKTKFAYSALVSHAERGTLILMECKDSDGNPAPVLCVLTMDDRCVPIARMLPEDANPYELFTLPGEQYQHYNAIYAADPVPDVTN